MADLQSKDQAYEEMTCSQKTALLLIALGQRWATEILRCLKVHEVKQVSFWINQMKYVPQELTERVIKEFYERLVRKTSLASSGGQDYLFDVLAGMMSESRAQELIDDLSQRKDTDVFKILRRVDPKQLAAYLKQEQSQTVAMLLSHLDPTRAATIMRELPDDKQTDILFRLARLEKSDPEIVSSMERALTETLGSMAKGSDAKEVGGVKLVAEILNNVDKEREKTLLEELGELDFELAADIKDLMFVFADVILLDDKSIQTLVKDVEQADLILALKGSSDAVKEKIFRNISKRQAETIEDELSFMGPVKSSQVQEAQQKIVNLIRKLDEEGSILIQGKGGDDIIA